MTVRHMRIFVEVYQTGNITRAAAALHMTQPAVSRAIQELEHYYGVRLFERLNRRLSVTEAGTVLYSQAVHIVESFDSLERGLRDWDEFGVLRIGASITLGTVVLPEAIAQFKKEQPHVKVKVTVSNGGFLQEALLSNRLDLALVEGSIEDENLVTKKFAEDCLVLVLPPDYQIPSGGLLLEDLQHEDMLLRENGSFGRTFLAHIFALHNLPLEPAWESTSVQALIRAVSYGHGISFLPKRLAEDALARGIVKTAPVLDEAFERKNYMVWHRNKFLTRSAKEFMELFGVQA